MIFLTSFPVNTVTDEPKWLDSPKTATRLVCSCFKRLHLFSVGHYLAPFRIRKCGVSQNDVATNSDTNRLYWTFFSLSVIYILYIWNCTLRRRLLPARMSRENSNAKRVLKFWPGLYGMKYCISGTCRSISLLSFASDSVCDRKLGIADDAVKWKCFKKIFKKQ